MPLPSKVSKLFPYLSSLTLFRPRHIYAFRSLMTTMTSNIYEDRKERANKEGNDTDTADFRMPTCQGVDIEEASITQLQRHLTEGEFSGRELTACYLERIKQLNSFLRLLCFGHKIVCVLCDPWHSFWLLGIRAVIEVNPDALDIANGLDRERASGKVRSPLHGIPFLVKDVGNSLDMLYSSSLINLLWLNGNVEYSHQRQDADNRRFLQYVLFQVYVPYRQVHFSHMIPQC